MAKDSFKVKKSLNIEPKSAPTLDAEGDVGFNSTSHKLEIRDNSTTKSVVTENGTATLTNKTIDGANNTLSNIPSSSLDLASGTSISVATTNTNSSVNIGTGTGTNTINIGGANTTINMTGTVNSQNVTNLEVSDKLITINNGGAAGSGAVAGIEIEENGSATGYIATSADRNSWEFKAPNKAGVVSVTPPTSGTDGIVLESATQTLSNKTIATPTITGTITASNLTADRAIATGSGGVISASATTSAELGYLSGVTSGVQSQLNGKANKYLSNLDSTTNVNATLKPQAANTYDLGSSSYPWAEVFSTYSQANEEMRSPLFKAKENLIGSTKYVNIYGPASMASSYDLKLPSSQGAAKSVLTNDGSGNLTWVAGEIGAAKGESLVLAASSPTLNGAAILQADSTSKGFLPPRMTQAQRDAISSPVAGLSIYNTDTNKLNVHNGTSWGEVGSGGGGINYIASSDGNGSTGWATYADAAGTDPVDGTGGSADVTFATSSNSDLRGTTNFLFTHQAANRQGQGFSYDFTIDKADQAKMLQIRFDYLVASGTYADGDLTVWIYDKTNSKLIQPAPYKILNAVGAQPWIGEFQTASDSTSYRLIFHVTTNTATAYTMRFDNFSVGPQMNRAYGTPVTDWQSYTLVPQGVTTNPTVASNAAANKAMWRRVGDSMEIIYNYYHDTGSNTGVATGSGQYLFPLPSGYSIDSSKIYVSTDYSAGGQAGNASGYSNTGTLSDRLEGHVYAYSTTRLGVCLGNASVNSTAITSSNFAWGNTTIVVNFQAKVPITGWSSNTVMTSTTRTAPTVQTFTSGSGTYYTPAGVKYIRVRMVGGGGGGGASATSGSPTSGGNGGDTTFGNCTAGKGFGGGLGTGGGSSAAGVGGTATVGSDWIGTGFSGGSGTAGSNDITVKDSGGAGASSPFGGGGGGGNYANAPQAGRTNTGAGGGGAGTAVIGGASGSGGGAGAYIDAILVNPGISYSYAVGAGGTAGAQGGGNGNAGAAGGSGVIIVEEYYRDQGQIAASETIAGRVYANTGASLTSTWTAITFANKTFDTHGAFTTDTLTIPASGIYELNAYAQGVSNTWAAGNSIQINFLKNGTTDLANNSIVQAQTTAYVGISTFITGQFKLNAGDTIKVRVYGNSSNAMTLDNTPAYFNWRRVGNY